MTILFLMCLFVQNSDFVSTYGISIGKIVGMSIGDLEKKVDLIPRSTWGIHDNRIVNTLTFKSKKTGSLFIVDISDSKGLPSPELALNEYKDLGKEEMLRKILGKNSLIFTHAKGRIISRFCEVIFFKDKKESGIKSLLNKRVFEFKKFFLSSDILRTKVQHDPVHNQVFFVIQLSGGTCVAAIISRDDPAFFMENSFRVNEQTIQNALTKKIIRFPGPSFEKELFAPDDYFLEYMVQ